MSTVDVEKMGAAFAEGDWATVTSLADECSTLSVGDARLVLARSGSMTMEYVQDSGGPNKLEAHVHPDVATAGACFAAMVTIAREEAALANAVTVACGGQPRVMIDDAFPDYIPGTWQTA